LPARSAAGGHPGLGRRLPGGVSAPTRFYTLVPMAGPPTEAIPISAERGPAIGVGPVTLPGYLDRREIVTRRGRDEIELGEFDHWSEQLKDGAPASWPRTWSFCCGRNASSSSRGSDPTRCSTRLPWTWRVSRGRWCGRHAGGALAHPGPRREGAGSAALDGHRGRGRAGLRRSGGGHEPCARSPEPGYRNGHQGPTQ